jgi:hypothetical protein
MASAQAFHDQAARRYAVAIEARAKGNIPLANLLVDAAARSLDQATAAEATDATLPPPSPRQRQPVVQWHQVQPAKGEPDNKH